MSRGPGLRGLSAMNLPTRNPVATRELLAGPAATQVSTALQQTASKQQAMTPAAFTQGAAAERGAMTAAMAQEGTQQLMANRLLETYKQGLNEAVVQATGELPMGVKAMAERNLLGLSPQQVMAAAGMD
jgi:hypothetical protein